MENQITLAYNSISFLLIKTKTKKSISFSLL
jgi:hypothetical protein